MTRLLRLAPAFALIAATLGAFAQSDSAQPVAVSSVKELISALAPGRTIVLKKGDYLLSTAYGDSSEYAKWSDGEDGKELSLSGLKNVTIRGADGARIISDAGLSSILGVYDSDGVTFDNIRFVRRLEPGTEPGAGSLYAESVANLDLDRCSFEGGTTVAIELWECRGVSIKRCGVTGAASGVLSAGGVRDLELSNSRVSACEGYPLLYLEDSDRVLIKGTRFSDCEGGNFIEIYDEEGSADSMRFQDCVFSGNKFDYFAGPSILPSAESCQFEGNSFGEDWATESIAPASDGEGSSDEEYSDDWPAAAPLLVYAHPSELSFSYPAAWEMLEYRSEARVGVFAPDGKSFVFFLSAYRIPSAGAKVEADQNARVKKLFAEAALALAKIVKEGTGIAISIRADGEPYTDKGILSADYKGRATKDDGEKAELRLRFVVSGGLVEAMIGFAADFSSLDAGGEIDAIFASIAQDSNG